MAISHAYMASHVTRKVRPVTTDTNDNNDDDNHSSPWGWIILALIVAIILGIAGFFFYKHYRAKRLGVPGPRLNPFSNSNRISGSRTAAGGGVIGWVQSRWNALTRRNKRTAHGAYEASGLTGNAGRPGRGGFGRLDPDEAWDARVGNEADAYYEEQELGLHDPAGSNTYGRGGHGPSLGLSEQDASYHGASGQSELDRRYQEEQLGRPRDDPFGENAERSHMRTISPRPDYGEQKLGLHSKSNSKEDSPSERRSMFHEEV